MGMDLDNIEVLEVDDMEACESEISEVIDIELDDLSEAEIQEVQSEMSESRSLEDIQAEKETLIEYKNYIMENYVDCSEGDDEDPDQKVLTLTKRR